LQVAVIAAYMDRAEAVLHHAGRPQQDLVERRLLAERNGIDGAGRELVVDAPRLAGSLAGSHRIAWQ